ncbi:BCCT family transporter [Sapientia aquatica]|uniref:BCCT family transporter n=1 Tax=Sapientia aquatica TaxID=1549640 RepID=A0A4V3ATL1_9BURK|nr:BCCT family transporter [Sapientia aquatica]TDK60453.1 BCCT family transporter [Sapientia aquatica]
MENNFKRSIDTAIFIPAALILLAVSVPILVWPEMAGQQIAGMYDWITENLGLLYQWGVIGALLFLSWVAFGRHGSIRLGSDSQKPEFGNYAWISMLFCAGVGAGLIYWATIEWSHYIEHPPMDAVPGSEEGRLLAVSYGMFHWGPLAWAIYALPTVAISYQYYVRGASSLRLSTGCHGLISHPGRAKLLARIIDSLFVISLLAGAGTSIGLSIPMISASIADSVGATRSLTMDIAVVCTCIGLLSIAAYSGLSKGISKLASFNVGLAFVFLMFILLTGPTKFILRQGTESLGFMLQNSLRMLTYTDAVKRSGFVENWTIFYWAWWIAYGPIVGIFVTRISRGRTLRDLILGMAVFGSLGAWIFYIILGNYAYYVDMHHLVPVRQIVHDASTGQAISAVMGSLPFGNVMRGVFALIAIIFIAATYNSKAYALAACTSVELSVGEDPSRWNRVFWAVALGLLPIALILVNGGIKIAMSAVLVASLPLLFLSGMMVYNLLKTFPQKLPGA